MFATAQPTSMPTAAPTAAPSPLELRRYDNRAVYVFYAMMICFACMFVTVLLMKLCGDLQDSEFVSNCCAKVDACCCACFRKKQAPRQCLARVCETEIIPEHEFWTYLENDFTLSEPQSYEESTV